MQSSVSYSSGYTRITNLDKPMTATPVEPPKSNHASIGPKLIYYGEADAWIPVDQNKAFPLIDGYHRGRIRNGQIEVPNITIPDTHKMSTDVYHNRYCIFQDGKWIFSNFF